MSPPSPVAGWVRASVVSESLGGGPRRPPPRRRRGRPPSRRPLCPRRRPRATAGHGTAGGAAAAFQPTPPLVWISVRPEASVLDSLRHAHSAAFRPRDDGDGARVPPWRLADRVRASGDSRAWTETSEPRPKCGAAASPWPSAVRPRVLNSPPSSGGRRGD